MPASGGRPAVLGIASGVVFIPACALLLYELVFRLALFETGPAFTRGWNEVLTNGCIAGGVPILALGVYFGTRRRSPVFAHAFGWAALGTFALLMAPLAACDAFLTAWAHQQGG